MCQCDADIRVNKSSTRCYRTALTEEVIREELINNSGKQFDPNLVPVMLDMLSDGFVQTVQAKYPTTK